MEIFEHIREIRRQIRVQIHHFTDVAVELPNEHHIPGQALRNLGFVVLVYFIDEQAVVIKKELHLSRHIVEDGRHSPVHWWSFISSLPVHGIFVPKKTQQTLVATTSLPSLLQKQHRPTNRHESKHSSDRAPKFQVRPYLTNTWAHQATPATNLSVPDTIRVEEKQRGHATKHTHRNRRREVLWVAER